MPKEMNILDKAKMELVVARFDFKYIHELMTKMNWEWATRNGETRVRTVADKS